MYLVRSSCSFQPNNISTQITVRLHKLHSLTPINNTFGNRLQLSSTTYVTLCPNPTHTTALYPIRKDSASTLHHIKWSWKFMNHAVRLAEWSSDETSRHRLAYGSFVRLRTIRHLTSHTLSSPCIAEWVHLFHSYSCGRPGHPLCGVRWSAKASSHRAKYTCTCTYLPLQGCLLWLQQVVASSLSSASRILLSHLIPDRRQPVSQSGTIIF